MFMILLLHKINNYFCFMVLCYYVKTNLSPQVHDLVNTESSNNTELELQVLEVWDRLYETWFTKVCGRTRKSLVPVSLILVVGGNGVCVCCGGWVCKFVL